MLKEVKSMQAQGLEMHTAGMVMQARRDCSTFFFANGCVRAFIDKVVKQGLEM
jgi:hypothetical protein